jgi:AraC-like DNA-binding protein
VGRAARSAPLFMVYREFQPRPASRSFLHCLWSLETDGDSVQRIVPDGRSELIVNLGIPFESFRDGEWRRQPRAFLTGQLTGPLLVRPGGPAHILAARFHPHGAARVFDCPPADIILPVTIQAETVEALEDLLVARLRPGDPMVSEAVRRLTSGPPELAGLAAALGLSERQFERRFKGQIGLKPKLFCRILRFQRVFYEIESGGNWVQAALACGYYDQPHLVRDMRQFSGETPSALLKGDELARHFLSDFSKTPGRVLP